MLCRLAATLLLLLLLPGGMTCGTQTLQACCTNTNPTFQHYKITHYTKFSLMYLTMSLRRTD
jgi:hypothetical protein